MTKPTNVLLDPALRAAAKRRAHERGLSLSAYIRELIRDDDAAAAARAGDITPLIGFLGIGAEPSDIATNKTAIERAVAKGSVGGYASSGCRERGVCLR